MVINPSFCPRSLLHFSFPNNQVSPWESALAFDKDKNSMLSRDEILKAFQDQANAFFDAVDTNQDGQISQAEYEAYAKNMLTSDQ